MKVISTICTAILLLFVVSCNNESSSGSEETTAVDTAAKTEAPPSVPAKPANVMLVWHKVANYEKFLTGYEAHDSMRLASGIHNYIIGREVDNPNMILVATRMDDITKAKAFAASADLKTAMQKVGVVGAPSITFLDVQMNDTSVTATSRVMIMHKVKDYDAWKKEFDTHKQNRMDAGLEDRALGYSFDDKNSVVIVCGITDMKKAKDFMNSKDLKDKMEAAGVVGPPTIHFYNVAKKY